MESALAGQEVTYAIAGIGLNVNLPAAALGPFPDAALAPTTLLDLTGRAVSREALLLALLRHLGRLVRALYRQQPAAVLAPYREAQTLVGRAVRVAGAGDAGGAPVDGVAESVADDGALVLRLPGRRPAPLRLRGGHTATHAPSVAERRAASMTRCASQPSSKVGVSGRRSPSRRRGRMWPS